MHTHQPSLLPESLLAEIACPDEVQRFRACAAVCASVWAAGLNSCGTPAERLHWQRSYAEYLRKLAVAWTHETTPRP